MSAGHRISLVIVAVLAIVGCGLLYSRHFNVILESKDVQFFKVEEIPGPAPTRLRISGLVFKSAMSVRKITDEMKGTNVTVVVRVGLAKPGTSGSFSYEFKLPDSIRTVTFGTDPTPIWTRRTQ